MTFPCHIEFSTTMPASLPNAGRRPNLITVFSMKVLSYQHPELGSMTVILGNDQEKEWYCLTDLCKIVGQPAWYSFLSFAVNPDEVFLQRPARGGHCQKFISYAGIRTLLSLIRYKGVNHSVIGMLEEWVVEIHAELTGNAAKTGDVVSQPLFNEVFGALACNAEKVVLGTILVHPEFFSFHSLGRSYGKHVFTSDVNRSLFGYIQELFGTLNAVSPSLLVEYLRTRGLLDKTGGEEYVFGLGGYAAADVTTFLRTYGLLICNLAYGMMCEGHERLMKDIDSACGVYGIFSAIEMEDDVLVLVTKMLLSFEHYVTRSEALSAEQKAAVLKGWSHDVMQKCFNRTSVDLAVSRGDTPQVEGFLPFKRSAD